MSPRLAFAFVLALPTSIFMAFNCHASISSSLLALCPVYFQKGLEMLPNV
jgi:hypothetical protein